MKRKRAGSLLPKSRAAFCEGPPRAEFFLRWWAHQDLNLEPTDYESAALTVELWARSLNLTLATHSALGATSRLKRQNPNLRGIRS